MRGYILQRSLPLAKTVGCALAALFFLLLTILPGVSSSAEVETVTGAGGSHTRFMPNGPQSIINTHG